MSIVYRRIELLEFFDCEKIIDEEECLIEYTLRTDKIFLFKLYIAIYDEFTSVSLKYENWGNNIFDCGLNGVTRISLDNAKVGVTLLKFYRKTPEEPVLTVMLRPTISFQCDI